jgi:hypothetical protein
LFATTKCAGAVANDAQKRRVRSGAAVTNNHRRARSRSHSTAFRFLLSYLAARQQLHCQRQLPADPRHDGTSQHAYRRRTLPGHNVLGTVSYMVDRNDQRRACRAGVSRQHTAVASANLRCIRVHCGQPGPTPVIRPPQSAATTVAGAFTTNLANGTNRGLGRDRSGARRSPYA